MLLGLTLDFTPDAHGYTPYMCALSCEGPAHLVSQSQAQPPPSDSSLELWAHPQKGSGWLQQPPFYAIPRSRLRVLPDPSSCIFSATAG